MSTLPSDDEQLTALRAQALASEDKLVLPHCQDGVSTADEDQLPSIVQHPQELEEANSFLQEQNELDIDSDAASGSDDSLHVISGLLDIEAVRRNFGENPRYLELGVEEEDQEGDQPNDLDPFDPDNINLATVFRAQAHITDGEPIQWDIVQGSRATLDNVRIAMEGEQYTPAGSRFDVITGRALLCPCGKRQWPCGLYPVQEGVDAAALGAAFVENLIRYWWTNKPGGCVLFEHNIVNRSEDASAPVTPITPSPAAPTNPNLDPDTVRELLEEKIRRSIIGRLEVLQNEGLLGGFVVEEGECALDGREGGKRVKEMIQIWGVDCSE